MSLVSNVVSLCHINGKPTENEDEKPSERVVGKLVPRGMMTTGVTPGKCAVGEKAA